MESLDPPPGDGTPESETWTKLPPTARHPERVRWLGRVRIPIAGPYQPWARLYALPDGKVVVTLRLWERDWPVTRCYPVDVVRAYLRRSALLGPARTLEGLLRARGPHA